LCATAWSGTLPDDIMDPSSQNPPEDANAGDRDGHRPMDDDPLRAVSHQINNSLMVVAGLAEMVASTEAGLSPGGARRLSQIIEACERLTAEIQTLRAEARKKRPAGPGGGGAA
jgi:hypothetical protein